MRSGLSDGIATPFILIALAGAGTAAHEAGIGPGEAMAELLTPLLPLDGPARKARRREKFLELGRDGLA